MVGKLTPDNMLSASRIAQLMGQSPYATQNELLAEFIDRDAGKEPEPWEGNELTRWGDIHEGAVIAETARRLGLVDVQHDFEQAFFHDKLRMAASLDGMATGTRMVKEDHAQGIIIPGVANAFSTADKKLLLEIKTTQQAPEDLPPPHRGVLQLQAQMMCAGADMGAVCVLYRGSTLRIFLYHADAGVQARIAQAIEEFEQRRTDIDWYPLMNPADGNVAYSRVDDVAQPLDVSGGEVQDAIEALLEAKRAKKECDEVIADAETVIKDYMGNHEEANTVVDGKRVIVKWGMRNMKATQEKVVPAKPAMRVRQNALTVKELGNV
jgi:exonuclease VII small subunit